MEWEGTNRIIKPEKIRIGIQKIVSQELLDAKVSIEEHEEFLVDNIAISIHGFVWGENIETKTIKYPRDWWQAFKARWFPRWALMRWPAVYTEHRLDVMALYPSMRVSMPENDHVIHIRKHPAIQTID